MVSSKRTRSVYESDDSSLFALYGSPLPATRRDSDSFVPLHLQEVYDDHGRRRFHGAFTGGWSAGYFNTVGSREGWTPSTFVSSRVDRASIKGKSRSQRPEDFMDEEDLQEARDERQIESICTNTGDLLSKQDLSQDIFQLGSLSDNSVGSRLMGKMGWKPGQGTGPMVLRPVRFQTGCIEMADSKEYLFAPDDVEVPLLRSKPERHGLGFGSPLQVSMRTNQVDANQNSTKPTRRVHLSEATERVPSRKSWNRQAPLTGVSLDSDYDDDSDQDLGPRLTYTKPKVFKTKAKQLTTTSKISVKRNPTALAIGRNLHYLVPGFTLPLCPATSSTNASSTMYMPLEVPKGWSPVVPAKQGPNEQSSSSHTLIQPSLREKSFAIGETPLPGRSIFDFITPESRAKLALVSGNTMLPPAHGEKIPGSTTITSIADVYTTSSALDREAALAALARAKVAGGPYSADPTKYHRYIMYLRVQAKQLDPAKISSEMSIAELKLELAEFFNCARIFRPMTGFMATRFAPSSGQSMTNTSEEHKTQPKADDPAYEAAKLGMFGHLTRSTVSFAPVSLLYKRFNIPMPAHSTAPEERERLSPTPENETVDNLSRGTSTPVNHSTRSDDVVPGRPADNVFQDIFGDD